MKIYGSVLGDIKTKNEAADYVKENGSQRLILQVRGMTQR